MSHHNKWLIVTVCLPLPLSPHPYMALPVSQSLLVQSVSALCLDYFPGVSSYVSLYKSVLPHVTCGLLLMSACKPVWMSLPVFLCLLRLSQSSSPRSWIPVQHRDTDEVYLYIRTMKAGASSPLTDETVLCLA